MASDGMTVRCPEEPTAHSGSAKQPLSIKVNIATPSYGSTYSSAYVRSLFRLLVNSPARGLSFSFSEIDFADIVVARNYLLSNFYFNKLDCTHLLFIDDDMGFSDSLVYAMLRLDEDVVGAIYPKRHVDLRRLHALGNLPFERAYSMACDFVAGSALAPPENGFVEVDACGTGIMLVSRRCVDQMVAAMPEIVDRLRFRRLPFGSKFREFLVPFDRVKLEDRELSEDLSFCHRWRRRCGGKIFASIDSSIQHVGRMEVSAKFSERP